MTRKPEDHDPFVMKSQFPDLEEIFKFQHKSVQDIKESALFILDTNALFVPYNVGKKNLDDIINIYKLLIINNRLFIPSQVIREFFKNRPKRLASIISQLKNTQSRIQLPELGNYPLLEPLEDYQHLKSDQEHLSENFGSFNKSLKEVIKQIKSWRWNDPVSLVYGEIFPPTIFVDVKTEEKAILADLKRRLRHDVPPGYKDRDKPDMGIGDVLIWHTILELAGKEKKDVIFVSDDQKDDWWHKTHTSDKEPLFPRFELLEEFRRHTGGFSFHIVKFVEFLELFDAGKELIEQVRAIEAVRNAISEYQSNIERLSSLREKINAQIITLATNSGLEVKSDDSTKSLVIKMRNEQIVTPLFVAEFKSINRLAVTEEFFGPLNQNEIDLAIDSALIIHEILRKKIIYYRKKRRKKEF